MVESQAESLESLRGICTRVSGPVCDPVVLFRLGSLSVAVDFSVAGTIDHNVRMSCGTSGCL